MRGRYKMVRERIFDSALQIGCPTSPERWLAEARALCHDAVWAVRAADYLQSPMPVISNAKGRPPMDQALVQYVAQKIMQDLRSATTIDDAVLDAVYCYPFIDPVRAMVKREDWPQIRMAGERGSQSAWDFAIGGLTRHIASYPEVEKYLLAAWRDKPDFAHRYHVLFRVLDLKSNDDIVSRELWDFVKFNMHEFVFARVGWYGGRNAVLESVKQRLSDATFPRTKAWVYLVSAMASPDTNAVRDLLNEHLNSPHELTREVAQYLIHNFAAIARADD